LTGPWFVPIIEKKINDVFAQKLIILLKLQIWIFLFIQERGGDFLAKHKKIERTREIDRRRHRREQRKKLAAKAIREAAAAPQA
jgi:hypothetical protein